METLRTFIDKATEKVLVALMAIMTINVLWQVATRFLLEDASSFTEELARFLMIWISILGGAYLVGRRGHVAIDYLPSRLDEYSRAKLQRIVTLVIILFAFLIMVIGGGNLVYITLHLGQNSSAMQIPLGYIYSIVPLSGLIILFYSIHDLIRKDLTGQTSGATAI